MDLALDNLEKLICHKIQKTKQPTNQPYNLYLHKSNVKPNIIAFECLVSLF